MLSWIRKKQKQPYAMLGIDIKDSLIRLLELKQLNNEYEISHQVAVPLADLRSVVPTLQGVITELELKGKSAVMALPDSLVIKKTIQIEAELNPWEQEEQILFEAEQHVAYSPEKFALDFHISGRNQDNDTLLDVMLIAAAKSEVDVRVDIIKSAGLITHAVDVESNALERASINQSLILNNNDWLLCYGLALYGAVNAN